MKNKIKNILFIIFAIAALWFVRNQYSDYNLNKTISACVVAQKQTSEKFDPKKAKEYCIAQIRKKQKKIILPKSNQMEESQSN